MATGTMREQFVYLMLNDRNGHIKIGVAKDPKHRERTLQSEEPRIFVIATAPGGMAIESSLHRKYKEYRLRGEWFGLTPHQVGEIISGFEFVPAPGQEKRFEAYSHGFTPDELTKEELIADAERRMNPPHEWGTDSGDLLSQSDYLDDLIGESLG